jgi:hypothetical protein
MHQIRIFIPIIFKGNVEHFWNCLEAPKPRWFNSISAIFFIRPSKDGTYYVMALSVRGHLQFSGLFLVIFTAIGLKLGVLLCSQELPFQFAFRCDWLIFARVMPLEQQNFRFFQFSTFFRHLCSYRIETWFIAL